MPTVHIGPDPSTPRLLEAPPEHFQGLRWRLALALVLQTVLLLAICPGSAGAQPAASQEGASAPEPDAFDQALAKIQANDLNGAVADLERLRADGDRRASAALGALYVHLERHQEALDVLEPLLREREDPGVLYNAGRAAVALEKFDDGVAWLRRSAQLAPNSPAVKEIGVLLGRGGDYRAAFPFLRRWATLHPDDTDTRLLAAVAAVQLERAPDAESLLSDLPQEDPGVQLLWAQTLLLKGDPYGALGYLSPLVDAAPAAMANDVRRSAARAHLMAGESEEAIALLQGHVEGNPQASLQLAQAYYQAGQISQALAVLQPFAERIATSTDPSAGGTLASSIVLEQGRLLFTDNRPDEALRYLRLATELNPNEKQAWQVLGQALAASGDNEGAKQAIAQFQRLVDSQGRAAPNQSETERNDPTAKALRLAFEKMGAEDFEGALELMEQEALINPEDPRLPLVASRALLALKRPGEALSAAERSLQLQPTTDGLYQRGVVLMSLQRLDEAEESLRAALASNAEHGATLNDLAVLLMNQGRKEEARKLLQQALALFPEDPVAAKNLERLDSEG